MIIWSRKFFLVRVSHGLVPYFRFRTWSAADLPSTTGFKFHHLQDNPIPAIPFKMPVVLPSPFNIIFIFIEPLLTFLGAYSAFAQPEWYLASQIPGETDSGLLHTIETTMAIRLYGVLLTLLPLISLAVLPAIASKSDQLSWTIARRFFFVLAGILFPITG